MLLKIGDQGSAVADLIDDLRALGFALAAGQVYSLEVKRSVEAFQSPNVDSSGRPLVVDGKVGPHTRWAIDRALGRVQVQAATGLELPPVPAGGSASGRAALEVAMAEASAGRGEQGSDNHGPDVRRYLAGEGNEGDSWCAGFVSYCFREALGHNAVFGYRVGAQSVHQRMKALGHAYQASLANPPLPGDIITWRRVDPADPVGSAWKGHVGIVHGFQNGILWTVEGNRGNYPSLVKPFNYSWSAVVASETNDRFKGLFGLSRHP
jgi:peptidoglycan hydrolase-like protein with peptidoglycan-binding domain